MTHLCVMGSLWKPMTHACVTGFRNPLFSMQAQDRLWPTFCRVVLLCWFFTIVIHLVGRLTVASAKPWITNHPWKRRGRRSHMNHLNFGGRHHIFVTAEARVIKSCTQVSYIKSQYTDPWKMCGQGQGQVTHFKFCGHNDILSWDALMGVVMIKWSCDLFFNICPNCIFDIGAAR